MTADQRFQWACKNPSDIGQHVPMLFSLALNCPRITEFGVRGGVSTSAWLAALPSKLTCYDQNVPGDVEEFQSIAMAQGTEFVFIQADTATVEIEETDLLFLDTLHTGEHLSAELRNHEKVRRYLVFHDTETNGWNGEGGGSGLKKALIHFLLDNICWAINYHSKECNGLTVLEKVK